MHINIFLQNVNKNIPIFSLIIINSILQAMSRILLLSLFSTSLPTVTISSKGRNKGRVVDVDVCC